MSFCIASSGGGRVSRFHYNNGPERRSPKSAVRRELSGSGQPIVDKIGDRGIHNYGGSITAHMMGHVSPAPSGASVQAPLPSAVAPVATVEAISTSSRGNYGSVQPPPVAKHLAALRPRAGSLAAPIHSGRATVCPGSLTMSMVSPRIDEGLRRHSLKANHVPFLLSPTSTPQPSPSPARRDVRRKSGSPLRRNSQPMRWQGTSSPPLAPRETLSESVGSQPYGWTQPHGRSHMSQLPEEQLGPKSPMRREFSGGVAVDNIATEANKGGSIAVQMMGHITPAPSGSMQAPLPVSVPPVTHVVASSSSKGRIDSLQPPVVASHLASLSQRVGNLAPPVQPGRTTVCPGSLTMSFASPRPDSDLRRHSLFSHRASHLAELLPNSPSSPSQSPARRDVRRQSRSPTRRNSQVMRWHGTSSPPLAPRETRPNSVGSISYGQQLHSQGQAWRSVPHTPRTNQLRTQAQVGPTRDFPFGNSLASLISPRLESTCGLDQSFAKAFAVQRQTSTPGAVHLPFRQGASLTIGPCRSPPRRPVQQVSLDASILPLDALKCGVGNLRPLDESTAESWQFSLENARLDSLLMREVSPLDGEYVGDGCLEPSFTLNDVSVLPSSSSDMPVLEDFDMRDFEVHDDLPDTVASEITDADDHVVKLAELHSDEPIVYPCKEEYTWADVLLPARENHTVGQSFYPPPSGYTSNNDGFIFSHQSATIVIDDDGLGSTATNPPDVVMAELDQEIMLKLHTSEDERLRCEGGRALFLMALGLV